MHKTPYANVSNADLVQLRLATNALTACAEPLLKAGQLHADDWQTPTDILSWLGWQLDVEAEARGLAEPALCEDCGEPATRRSADGVPLCDGDYALLVEQQQRTVTEE